MGQIQKSLHSAKEFFINDNGKLIKITQPNMLELQSLYLTILEKLKEDRGKFNILQK